MKPLPTISPPFARKKEAIIAQLALPAAVYTDASPKGSVDVGIRSLVDEINGHAGLVTTSSCAGRVSVYLEGRKTTTLVEEEEEDVSASAVGGKGGGEWLFVSHEAVDGGREVFGMGREREGGEGGRLIHFKFEPMILHVLTASLEHAQVVIQAGMEAGFRETGAVSLLGRRPEDGAMPMVAVRSMGLSFESLVGVERDGERYCIVSAAYLERLVRIANERFAENQKRIARFQKALTKALAPKVADDWEDAETRRERKKQEGLKRRDELQKQSKSPENGDSDLASILQPLDVL